MSHEADAHSKIPSCDAYFDTIQSRKRLPYALQESLTSAFAQIPVSSFPEVRGGKVIEISSDMPIINAVRILSEHNILAAPVRNSEEDSSDWRERYLGIIDYSAIILWVLENAELDAFGLSAGSATVAGVGAGAIGALGAGATDATCPGAGAAMAGGLAEEYSVGKDAPTAADNLGENYNLLLQEEPFKSTTVKSIIMSYRWAPFLPVSADSSMLMVLLLLSKYRLRNVPVIESETAPIKNFITQSAVIQGLKQCKGRDWFDCIAARSLSDLGLPFMSYNEVICIKGDELILEAFKRMRDNRIGGLPVIEGPNRKLIGSLSIRDIRFLLLSPSLFSSFRRLTVMDFIKIKTSMNSEEVTSLASPVACSPDTCLGSVIDKLTSIYTHRIYVVEGDEHEVIGVVTLRDVISCFIYEPPGYFDSYFGVFDGTMKEMLAPGMEL